MAYEPEKLFKPWQEQYKEYTSKANDYYRNFHENGEYKCDKTSIFEKYKKIGLKLVSLSLILRMRL